MMRTNTNNHVSRKTHTRQRGAAMLLVLFAVAMAMVLGLSFINAQATSTTVAQNSVKRMRARAIAESGIAMAINFLEANPNWRTEKATATWLADHSMGNGRLNIRSEDRSDGDLADDPTDPVTLTVVSEFEGVSYRLHAVVTPRPKTNADEIFISTLGNIALRNGSTIDSFDSSIGPYGEDNIGSAAVVATNTHDSEGVLVGHGCQIRGDVCIASVMSTSTNTTKLSPFIDASQTLSSVSLADTTNLTRVVNGSVTGETNTLVEPIAAPDILVPTEVKGRKNTGDLRYGAGNHTISSNIRCDDLQISGGSIVNIVGDVTILVERDCVMSDAEIRLNPGARLTLFVMGWMKINHSLFNHNGADPTRCAIYMPSAARELVINEKSIVYAVVVAPDTWVTLENGGQLCGRILANKLDVSAESGVHMDENPVHSGSAAIAVSGRIVVEGSGVIDASEGGRAVITTNENSKDAIKLSTNVIGDVYVGPKGDPKKVIKGREYISGKIGVLDAPAAIPEISKPTGMPKGKRELKLKKDAIITAGKYRYEKVNINSGAVITISGEVEILCDAEFKLDSEAELRLLPNASLTLYGIEKLEFGSGSRVNVNTADPARFKIVGLGKDTAIKLENAATVYASVIAPNGTLEVTGNNTHLYGNYRGKNLIVKSGGSMHATTGGGGGAEGNGTDGWMYSVLWDEQP